MTGGAPGYAFGDSDVAARRLALLASVFEEPSRRFLAEEASPHPPLALDLGCGPGYTTELVASVTGARRTIGLDVSEAFVAAARVRTHEGSPVEYRCHDVAHAPLPDTPALIYERLLLAHLPDVERHVAAWVRQLEPAGRLLLDEVEWIATDHPVLAAYEELVVEVVAARGAVINAGALVDGIESGNGCRRRSSVVHTFPVGTVTAARMYSLNLAAWRDDPAVAALASSVELDELAAGLDRLGESGEGRIEWGLRQVAFERVG
jgi:SAM-dependent methyltransferase